MLLCFIKYITSHITVFFLETGMLKESERLLHTPYGL